MSDFGLIWLAAFLGSLIGGAVINTILIRRMARGWGYNMNKGLNDFIEEKEKELEEKIKRRTF